jgi:hypothetical protein
VIWGVSTCVNFTDCPQCFARRKKPNCEIFLFKINGVHFAYFAFAASAKDDTQQLRDYHDHARTTTSIVRAHRQRRRRWRCRQRGTRRARRATLPTRGESATTPNERLSKKRCKYRKQKCTGLLGSHCVLRNMIRRLILSSCPAKRKTNACTKRDCNFAMRDVIASVPVESQQHTIEG